MNKPSVFRNKIKIIKLELLPGSSFARPNGTIWTEDMFLVNDRYIASTIDAHNDKAAPWKFDFKIGETADVVIRESYDVQGEYWIRRYVATLPTNDMHKIKIPNTKLKITSVEEVNGSEKEPHYTSPMYKINGKFWASSIEKHNYDRKPFSLVVGRTYNVGVTEKDWIWPI